MGAGMEKVGGGWGGVIWHLGIWSTKIQFELKLPNLPTFYFTGRLVGCRGRGGYVACWNLKSKSPTWLETSKFANFPFHLAREVGGWGGQVVLWNLKSKNPSWLETSKSANFSFNRKGAKQHIEIWSPKIQLDLKLPNLPTFLFTGGGGGVQKSNLTWPTFNFTGGGGGGEIKRYFEIWSPKILLDLKLPNLPTFHFMGGVGGVKWHFLVLTSGTGSVQGASQ